MGYRVVERPSLLVLFQPLALEPRSSPRDMSERLGFKASLECHINIVSTSQSYL